MLSSDSLQYQPGISTVSFAPLYSMVTGRTPRSMGAPVAGQTGLVILFLLKRQQQIRGKLDVERADLRGHEVHVLPNPVIGIRGHGFVEMLALHRPDRRHNFGAPKPERGRTPHCRASDVKAID